MSAPIYSLDLVPVSRTRWRKDLPPATVRLRGALKCLLRTFGLRCVAIRPVESSARIAPRRFAKAPAFQSFRRIRQLEFKTPAPDTGKYFEAMRRAAG